MSLPTIEEETTIWIEGIKDIFLKQTGRLPTEDELEQIIDEGDWRRGEE